MPQEIKSKDEFKKIFSEVINRFKTTKDLKELEKELDGGKSFNSTGANIEIYTARHFLSGGNCIDWTNMLMRPNITFNINDNKLLIMISANHQSDNTRFVFHDIKKDEINISENGEIGIELKEMRMNVNIKI